MDKNTLRIRILGFRSSSKRKPYKTLFYAKKLIETSSDNGNNLALKPNQLTTASVVSLNETFDWNINEGNYCQILCLALKPKSKPVVITDGILWFDHLLDLAKDRKHNKEFQAELFCAMALEKDYRFEFSVQHIEDSTSDDCSPLPLKASDHVYKISSQRRVNGHLMKVKQFNNPVYCAICRKFIWGMYHQGYRCSLCHLVTHKECHGYIPFCCQKSTRPGETPPLAINIPHIFKRCEMPFVTAIVRGCCGYCNHCGSSILWNGLKCTQCHFMIHERCQSSIPPMCTIQYKSIVNAWKDSLTFNIRFHQPKIKKPPNGQSKTSSIDPFGPDISQYLPLENQPSRSLPKFDDFECIGRLGDGACAQVYCVQHISSKKYYAVKVADGLSEQAQQQLEVEKRILFRYSDENPYIIKPYCAFHQGSKLFLVMELVEHGTLYDTIQRKRMNEDEIRYYLAQIICVLQYLHSKKIVYRDLKLEHAAICSANSIHLIDFGLARLLKTADEVCHTFCGTDTYMAPEVRCLENGLSTEGYSYPVDFWALGIMFIQMLCGERVDYDPQAPSFDHGKQDELESRTQNLELPHSTSLEARSCVMGLLENDPKIRLGSPNSPHGLIRDHPFFKAGHSINWQLIDDGLFKSSDISSKGMDVILYSSYGQPLPNLKLDRSKDAKDSWIAAGLSTCSSEETEKFKLFDYISSSRSNEFNTPNLS